MRYSVENILHDTAQLCGDDGRRLQMPTDALPQGLRTGDVLLQTADGAFVPQPDTAAARRKKTLTLFRLLKKRSR